MINVREEFQDNMDKSHFFWWLTADIDKNLGYDDTDLIVEIEIVGINRDIIDFNVYAGELLLRSWTLGETYMVCYYETFPAMSYFYYMQPDIIAEIEKQFKNLTEDKVYCTS